jgi:hypothetical protein
MEHATGTLLCSDLFADGGIDHPPLFEGDILGPSDAFRRKLEDFDSQMKETRALLALLAALKPKHAHPHSRQRLARRWPEFAAGARGRSRAQSLARPSCNHALCRLIRCNRLWKGHNCRRTMRDRPGWTRRGEESAGLARSADGWPGVHAPAIEQCHPDRRSRPPRSGSSPRHHVAHGCRSNSTPDRSHRGETRRGPRPPECRRRDRGPARFEAAGGRLAHRPPPLRNF